MKHDLVVAHQHAALIGIHAIGCFAWTRGNHHIDSRHGASARYPRQQCRIYYIKESRIGATDLPVLFTVDERR
ncbi:MAG TPA: hypothetical protein VGR52_06550 [Stellaceae bacterium]|nr:hypothetical protein [Stellaceae bacterium]